MEKRRNIFLFVFMLLVFVKISANKIEVDGIRYRIDKNSKTASVIYGGEIDKPLPPLYSGDIIIPETIMYEGDTFVVTSIESGTPGGMPYNQGAFIHSMITSIVIPKSIESIDAATFYDCKQLTRITFLGAMKSITGGSFSGCDELKTFCITDIASWCSTEAHFPFSQAEHIFVDGKEIDHLIIPDGVTEIKPFVFGCINCLNSITLPCSIVSIGDDAFAWWDNMKDVYCYAEKCPVGSPFGSRGQIHIDATLHVYDYAVEDYKGTFPWGNFTNITVFEKVTDFNLTYHVDNSIYRQYKYKYDDEIVPEPAPTKKGHTFSGWSEIPERMPGKDVDVNGSFTWSRDTISGVIYQVTDTIHNYCSIIGNYMATGELTPVSNPVFDEKYLLISIEKGTFKNNTDITSVVVPDSVVSVGDNAFNGCKNVTMLGLNKYIEKIGERAFANIDKLTDVTIYAEDVPETDRTAFENSYVDYATLHVPYGSVDKYKAFGPWKDFKEIIAIEGTQRTFVLTYKVDGEVYKTYEIKEGETITPEAEPIKEGYTFSGWSDIPAVMPSEDLTITGTFTINKYKLTYIVDEKEYKVFEVEYNATITPVPAPEKEGYTFSGWSEIPEKMPAKDVTVTGTFIINKYKLVYKVDNSVYNESEVVYGAAITPLEAPTKEGYTFSGWSEIPETMPAKDVTVTGTFTINKYKLTYMVDGEVYKTYDVEYGATVTPEAEPTKEGYTFSGWSTIPETMPAHDVTITGSFTKGAYKLIYKIDGEVYKTYTYDFGAEITPEPAPEKEGYTFSGWSDIPTTMPANDVEVTGSFAVNKYNLIYKVDGEVYKEYEMEYGAEITPEEEPTKEGWEFSGWSWIPKKMPAEDVIITGTFKQVDYEADGGTYTIADGEATLKDGGEAKGELVINNNVTIDGKVYVIVNIGDGAFKGNKDITSVELPDGIKNIGSGAFDGCSSLLKVLLGKGVKKIGSKAFGNIWKAATTRTRTVGDGFRVECNAESVPEIEADAFEGTEIEKATLVVQDELVNSYKTAEVWKNFGSIIGFTEATGVDGIFVDNPSAVIYSIDGRRLNKVQKGMNVIRTEKGVKKVVVR